jgi:hypothetical protein
VFLLVKLRKHKLGSNTNLLTSKPVFSPFPNTKTPNSSQTQHLCLQQYGRPSFLLEIIKCWKKDKNKLLKHITASLMERRINKSKAPQHERRARTSAEGNSKAWLSPQRIHRYLLTWDLHFSVSMGHKSEDTKSQAHQSLSTYQRL